MATMKIFLRQVFLYLIILTIHAPAMASDEGFRFESNRSRVSLPIIVRNNLAVVPLYINNNGPFHFILDTGVNTTILTEPLIAHLLNLKIESEIMVYGLGGEGVVPAALATGVEIDMRRGVKGYDKNLLVIPEDILSFSEVFGFPVYGIIGYDFFRSFPVEINYSTETMRIYKESTYRTRRRTTTVPIRLIDGKPYVQSTIIGEQGDTLNTNLLLDLGASHPVYLNRRYQYLSDLTIKGFLGKGISGNLMGKKGRAEKVLIGDVEIHNPIVAYPDAEFLTFYDQEISWEGIIGGAILKRFTVTIDYQEEKLLLRRNRFLRQPFNTSLSGMEVIATGRRMDTYTIHYVRPGSVSYEAGVMPGDEIIALNSHRNKTLTMEIILDELSARIGHPIHVVIRRDGQLLRKNFRLREDLL